MKLIVKRLLCCLFFFCTTIFTQFTTLFNFIDFQIHISSGQKSCNLLTFFSSTKLKMKLSPLQNIVHKICAKGRRTLVIGANIEGLLRNEFASLESHLQLNVHDGDTARQINNQLDTKRFSDAELDLQKLVVVSNDLRTKRQQKNFALRKLRERKLTYGMSLVEMTGSLGTVNKSCDESVDYVMVDTNDSVAACESVLARFATLHETSKTTEKITNLINEWADNDENIVMFFDLKKGALQIWSTRNFVSNDDSTICKTKPAVEIKDEPMCLPCSPAKLDTHEQEMCEALEAYMRNRKIAQSRDGKDEKSSQSVPKQDEKGWLAWLQSFVR